MKYIVKLRFISPLHVGTDDAGIGTEGAQSIIHSDTLVSGICNAWGILSSVQKDANMTTDLTELLKRFNSESPPFCLSSAFHFSETMKGNYYYLPKPLLPVRKEFNRFSKISFLELDNFKKWAQGKVPSNIEEDVESNVCVTVYNPRTGLDRITSGSNIYHCSSVHFNQGCGLYFIIEVEEDYFDRLKLTVDYLGETGVGGERSIGYGRFKAEWVDISDDPLWKELWQLEDSNASAIISLCYPSQKRNEVQDVAAYDLIVRKGWVYSSSVNIQLKRKTCYMFSEGSIFKNNVKGQLASITPRDFNQNSTHHDVYRYGLAFTVPLKLSEEDFRYD